jgi:dUTP diphosphatase
LILKVQRHYPDMPLPARAHASDAGFDLIAMAVEPVRAGVFAFDTGISVHAEPGYYCEVVPRSSIVKTDFLQANSVGVIDPDYRGRIRVVLRYVGAAADGGAAEARALLGSRIAQLLVRRVERVVLEPAETLEDTPRGAGGFGSTGR